VTEIDLVSSGEELLQHALRLARASLDPAVVNSHFASVKAGRRILILRIGHCAHRVQLECWTEGRAGQGEDVGRFPLVTISERVDGEDFPTDSGC
jgi:hypothetical protein